MTYAGFFRRWAALFIDGIILIIPAVILGFSTGITQAGIGIGFLLNLIYKPIFESSKMKATPGKALMGIVVVSETGMQLTVKQAFIRFFCSYISLLIAYIGYLMQPFTAKRQTLHDMVAESIVIREQVPDYNYFVVWRDQVKDVFARL